MKCKNCNKKIPSESKFCRHCGEQQSSTNIALKNSEKHALEKRYRDTGNSSFALGIVGYLATVGLSLFVDETVEVDAVYFLAVVIINFFFFLPYIYYGRKIKEIGTSNLVWNLVVNRNLAIYTIIFVGISLLSGQFGWLWFILLYYFYKSYAETKNIIESKS